MRSTPPPPPHPRTDCLPASFALAVALGLVGLIGTAGAADPPSNDRTKPTAGAAVAYNRDVRPVLADACFRCHGPAAKKGGFRLDEPGSATKPADSGETPVVPGQPDASEVVRRIRSTDPDEVMPPPSTKKALRPADRELITRWIAAGAPYQKHWAFETPTRPQVPKVEAKEIRVVNPIDAFLGERLAREGLAMSPEADRRTLIRRVAFALTGLPPTPREVDDFVNDPSTRAYENLVERYLHSPRYGEEMARHWLDVARYADTHGLHLDNERQMWMYRDWVVRAFNDNVPFDRFTIEQIAGDLLPGATPDQLVATGFQRCNVTTGEGGSIEAEWVFRNAVDRASTMAEAWLGLTAGCAVCHDHKFDPIRAKDFYALYSFFYSAEGPPLDGNVPLHEPVVRLYGPGEKEQIDRLDQELAAARAALAKASAGHDYRDPEGTDPLRSYRAWIQGGGKGPGVTLPPEIRRLVDLARADKLPEARVPELRAFYVQQVCVDTKAALKPLADKVAALEKDRNAKVEAVSGSMVFREMKAPRPAFVMMRGQYDKPGEPVEPNTPSAFPPLKKADPKARATRLDLAHWLVDPENPLTACVAMNRLWQQLFGTGLVKTSNDFGTQGEPPSHPELLDWLAVTFRESGWDVRGMVRLMVNSAAFRQSSRVTPELRARDPENRLYARGPRFRLDAEQVRDNALAVAGLIDLTMGGRGVRPYQPPNIWEPVAFTGSNTRSYVQDHGPNLHRRSVYTFLKRTAPAPFLANFDAPSREAFCARRERSNTPLQALQLMNDVQHVEAARALAERVLVEAGPTPAERLKHAFLLVVARPPEEAEAAVLQKQLSAHLARFQADPTAAKELVGVGEARPRAGLAPHEVAAWTLVANTLLNLDETVTRN